MDSTSIQFRSHTALLLAAALPYLQPAYRHPVELALKFLELSETLKLYREFHLTGAESGSPLHKKQDSPSEKTGIWELIFRFILDPEGLLHSLSKVCTGKEQEIVGMLLNLMQAKNFYENYGDILSSFMSSDMSPDFSGITPDFSKDPQTDSTPANNTPADNSSMPDMASILSGGGLTSMLNQEQSDTLNLLKNLLDAD